MKTTTRQPMIDENAAPCLRCGCTRATYTCDRHQATRKHLCRCDTLAREDVAFEVHKRVTTIDAWRSWWSKVYDNAVLPPVA